MKIRGIRPEDMKELKAIHERMGFGYPWPDLKVFDVAKVMVGDDDKPVMAVLGVPVMEMYFLMDPNFGDPQERFDRLKQIYAEMHKEVKDREYGWAIADLPPEVEKSFGRRLGKFFGWIKSPWNSYAVKV